MNNLPVKVVGNSTIYLRDVSHVSDGFIPQTNIVRQDGHRGVLTTVIKDGDASTLSVVQGIRNLLPRVSRRCRRNSKFTAGGPVRFRSRRRQRCCPRGWHRRGPHGANDPGLPGKLAQHRDHRRFYSAAHLELRDYSQPSASNHQPDDAGRLGSRCRHPGGRRHRRPSKISRHLEEGQPLHQGILDGAAQIAVPALVSTLCICIVFLPMFSLGGVAHFLFQPLAEAVDLRYARVVHPVANPGTDAGDVPPQASRRKCCSLAQSLYARTEGVRPRISNLSPGLPEAPHNAGGKTIYFCSRFFAALSFGRPLIPWLGQDFFPNTDSGQFILHVRAKTGTRSRTQRDFAI